MRFCLIYLLFYPAKVLKVWKTHKLLCWSVGNGWWMLGVRWWWNVMVGDSCWVLVGDEMLWWVIVVGCWLVMKSYAGW